MNKLNLLHILLLVFFTNCRQAICKNENERLVFKIPFVIQETNSYEVKPNIVDSLSEVWYLFHGKYTFTDTLKLSNNYDADISNDTDYIWGVYPTKSDDTLHTDGLQVFADYETNIYPKYDQGHVHFPVYIVNETSQTKIFYVKGSSVLGVQEAIDTSVLKFGNWHPIESKGSSFCNTGNFVVKIHPEEFIVVLVPKYEGDEKQLMRVRIPNGESIYVSKAYLGSFSKNQFYFSEQSNDFKKMQNHVDSYILYKFFGAIPKGFY
jgi:hypothetical protein